MNDYIGHDEAWSEWRNAMAGARMHHGWILSGRRGVGKSSFAVAAARELLAEPGVPQPAGDHADILHLTYGPKDDKEEKKRADGKEFELARSIRVGQIRQLQHRLTTRPTLGSRRVVIIDPADDLERNAANAVLKSLEEPPSGTFFILIAHRIGGLLPTIRSRCRVLSFPEVGESDMQAILEREAAGASDDVRAAAIAAAGGSPGVALDFVALDLGRLHEVMRELSAKGDTTYALRGRLSAALGTRPSRPRQQAAIDLAMAVVKGRMDTVTHAQIPALVDTHCALAALAAELQTHNYDPGLLIGQIGTLLSHLATPREPAHG